MLIHFCHFIISRYWTTIQWLRTRCQRTQQHSSRLARCASKEINRWEYIVLFALTLGNSQQLIYANNNHDHKLYTKSVFEHVCEPNELKGANQPRFFFYVLSGKELQERLHCKVNIFICKERVAIKLILCFFPLSLSFSGSSQPLPEPSFFSFEFQLLLLYILHLHNVYDAGSVHGLSAEKRLERENDSWCVHGNSGQFFTTINVHKKFVIYQARASTEQKWNRREWRIREKKIYSSIDWRHVDDHSLLLHLFSAGEYDLNTWCVCTMWSQCIAFWLDRIIRSWIMLRCPHGMHKSSVSRPAALHPLHLPHLLRRFFFFVRFISFSVQTFFVVAVRCWCCEL